MIVGVIEVKREREESLEMEYLKYLCYCAKCMADLWHEILYYYTFGRHILLSLALHLQLNCLEPINIISKPVVR
jgi:hypothetical protein